MDPHHVEGKRISVIGGARSGRTVARLLKEHGADVFLSDNAPAESMAETARELGQLDVAFEFGGNTAKALASDMMVLSPGVPSDAQIVRDAFSRGLEVVSEVEVASWFCPCPIIAVTGTNGKTTTTTLLGRMFADAKHPAAVGGNIGVAFSQIVEELNKEDMAILEISSFQLDHIQSFKPRVSVMLNITPDHLDRYEHSFEKYIASKCRIFRNQNQGDVLIYNYDDPVVRERVEMLAPEGVRKLPFSATQPVENGAYVHGGRMVTHPAGKHREVMPVADISIPGRHNLYNAMAATLAAQAMGISTASLRATLRNFKGVEHRLEFVREAAGVAYINDSKATNVDSVWYALQSFDRPLVLLLGGRDKGNDYSLLRELVKQHVRAIVAIGESAGKVVEAFRHIVPVTTAASMEDAVHLATRVATPGDIVLLSPACASFDWFKNYEHRGRVFKDLVSQL